MCSSPSLPYFFGEFSFTPSVYYLFSGEQPFAKSSCASDYDRLLSSALISGRLTMSGIDPARIGHSQLLFGLPRLLFCCHGGEEESKEGCESSLAVYGTVRSRRLALPALRPLL
jgi:hypothetical protein